jgi:hypothetical protein
MRDVTGNSVLLEAGSKRKRSQKTGAKMLMKDKEG